MNTSFYGNKKFWDFYCKSIQDIVEQGGAVINDVHRNARVPVSATVAKPMMAESTRVQFVIE